MSAIAVGSVTLSPDFLRQISERIKQVDTEIARSSGSDSQLKQAVLSELPDMGREADPEGNFDKAFDMIRGYLLKEGQSDIVVAGLVTRLSNLFAGEEIKNRVDKAVKDAVDSKKANTDTSNVDELKEQRKSLVDDFKSVRQLLKSMGQLSAEELKELDEVTEPKARANKGNSNSKNVNGINKEYYRFYIDDNPSKRTQNKISSLAYYATNNTTIDGQGESADVNSFRKTDKSDDRIGVAEFKKWLSSQGVNYGPPGAGDDEWGPLTLPNGKTVRARRLTDDDINEFREGVEKAGGTWKADETTPEDPNDSGVDDDDDVDVTTPEQATGAPTA